VLTVDGTVKSEHGIKTTSPDFEQIDYVMAMLLD
jgi:hypothetical protein